MPTMIVVSVESRALDPVADATHELAVFLRQAFESGRADLLRLDTLTRNVRKVFEDAFCGILEEG